MNREFITRRLQSLAGFFFLLFLCEHLFTNSQATLLLGEDGKSFISTVNWIHSLPYFTVVELLFVALPLLVHVWWGFERLFMAKINSIPSNGNNPSLPYKRNIAFTWQRITSILLVVAIGLHVYYMRFVKEPTSIEYGVHNEYFVRLSVDPGLYTLAPRLNFLLFDKNMIERAQDSLSKEPKPAKERPLFERTDYDESRAEQVKKQEKRAFEAHLVDKMQQLNPTQNEVVAMCNSYGTAMLMMLRDAYKSIFLCSLYSLFVIIASFHACNGLWTFAITWGVTLSPRSQYLMRIVSNCLMGLLIFFGLACIWGVYWINLRF
jgi:succinate dehydrogenase / fumarate reductase cytochrome b subunit